MVKVEWGVSGIAQAPPKKVSVKYQYTVVPSMRFLKDFLVYIHG
jgi:hypothetical protein